MLQHQILNTPRDNKKPAAGLNNSDEEPFFVSYVPHRTGTFHVNLFDSIQSPDQFTFALQALEAADEENGVIIHLQCCGGHLGATDAFIHAMRKSKGHVHVIATGLVASAATMILLEADSFELSEGFYALLHNGSTGSVGNLNEYLAQTEFDKHFLPRLFRSAYEGFLSNEEIDNLLKGQDIWLDAKGWLERFNARNEYYNAKNAAKIKSETVVPDLTENQVAEILKIIGKPVERLPPEKVKKPVRKKQVKKT